LSDDTRARLPYSEIINRQLKGLWMDEQTAKLRLDQPAGYRIVVQGRLDASWSSWFDQMTVACGDDTTILTGIVRDQAKLQGMLRALYGLGLPLLVVEYLRGEER
jgi:hypothetical protein